MTTNFNQFKDTTIYGNFNNSTGKSRTANAVFDGVITTKNNMNVNADLYVGKITETTDLNGIVSNVITGGEIYSKGNNINTFQPGFELYNTLYKLIVAAVLPAPKP